MVYRLSDNKIILNKTYSIYRRLLRVLCYGSVHLPILAPKLKKAQKNKIGVSVARGRAVTVVPISSSKS